MPYTPPSKNISGDRPGKNIHKRKIEQSRLVAQPSQRPAQDGRDPKRQRVSVSSRIDSPISHKQSDKIGNLASLGLSADVLARSLNTDYFNNWKPRSDAFYPSFDQPRDRITMKETFREGVASLVFDDPFGSDDGQQAQESGGYVEPFDLATVDALLEDTREETRQQEVHARQQLSWPKSRGNNVPEKLRTPPNPVNGTPSQTNTSSRPGGYSSFEESQGRLPARRERRDTYYGHTQDDGNNSALENYSAPLHGRDETLDEVRKIRMVDLERKRRRSPYLSKDQDPVFVEKHRSTFLTMDEDGYLIEKRRSPSISGDHDKSKPKPKSSGPSLKHHVREDFSISNEIIDGETIRPKFDVKNSKSRSKTNTHVFSQPANSSNSESEARGDLDDWSVLQSVRTSETTNASLLSKKKYVSRKEPVCESAKLFISYTISDDRSGNAESVMKQRLSGLGERHQTNEMDAHFLPTKQKLNNKQSDNRPSEKMVDRPESGPEKLREKARRRRSSGNYAQRKHKAILKKRLEDSSDSNEGEMLDSPSGSLKTNMHDDRTRHITLRRLTKEEAAAQRGERLLEEKTFGGGRRQKSGFHSLNEWDSLQRPEFFNERVDAILGQQDTKDKTTGQKCG